MASVHGSGASGMMCEPSFMATASAWQVHSPPSASDSASGSSEPPSLGFRLPWLPQQQRRRIQAKMLQVKTRNRTNVQRNISHPLQQKPTWAREVACRADLAAMEQ